jgi:broad specificity phosphatase PhoE
MSRLKTVTVGLVVMLMLVPALAHAQKLVIVVRHAERSDGGAVAGQMGGDRDPGLSAAGAARAARLASMLADSGITAIFATEFRRTKDTASPLASKLKLPVQSMIAKDTAALVAKIKSSHAGGIVLVVGHSNTVPDVIKQFGGPAVTIADDEYDNLFIVVPATGAMTRLRFQP